MTPARQGQAALGAIGGSLALVWLTALLGHSVAARTAPGGSALPLTLGLRPSAWLVTALLVAATLIGTAGAAVAWRALEAGWAPRPRRLVAGALLASAAFVLVPPVTSDDVYSYAAYGRMAATGRDPYTTRPVDLDDPVGRSVGRPWRRSPSIYGPAATAEQAAAMRVAGTSVRLGVWLLQVAGVVAVGLTVLLLDRVAGDDVARRRAALLFGLNPLVVVHLSAAAHVDALLVLPAVAAVALVLRRPASTVAMAAAGGAAGLALSVKLTGALVVAGLLVPLRRDLRRAAAYLAGVALVALPAYAAAGGTRSLTQARKAAQFVSYGVPWRRLVEWLDPRLGFGRSRPLVGLLALGLGALLGVLLWHARRDDAEPVRAPLVVTLAWLLAATYVLPWYDALAWALLALAVRSRWDRLLLAHTAVLTLAYLPGRTVSMPAALATILAETRRTVAPVVLGATVVVAIAWSLRRDLRTGSEPA